MLPGRSTWATATDHSSKQGEAGGSVQDDRRHAVQAHRGDENRGQGEVRRATKQLATGRASIGPATTITVAQVLDEWLDRDLAGRNVAPQTVELHRWAADRIKAEIGNERAAKLTVRQVDDMLDDSPPMVSSRSSLLKVREHLVAGDRSSPSSDRTSSATSQPTPRSRRQRPARASERPSPPPTPAHCSRRSTTNGTG